MTRASDTAKLLGAGATILDGTTISTADNTSQLTLQSTDADATSGPQLTLKRDSSSPADNDFVGRIKYIAENDASQEVPYVDLLGRIMDASDGTEDASFFIKVMNNGSDLATFSITPTEVVINDDTADIDFRVESNNLTHALFVDGANGNIGIGATSATNGKLLVSGASGTLGGVSAIAQFAKGATGGGIIEVGDNTAILQMGSEGTNAYLSTGNNALRFLVNSAQRMKIDASGNLLVKKTAVNFQTAGFQVEQSSGETVATRASGTPIVANRLTNDGEIIGLYKDSSLVGRLGSASSRLHIAANGNAGIRFRNDLNCITPCNDDGSNSDNDQNLGQASVRYNTIFATNASINTSDRTEKQDIAELSDAEKRVAVVAKGLMRKYRWKDAVASKGDKARIHFGIIAQDLQDAFTAESLDASRYSMFCSDTWWEKEITVDAVEAKDAVYKEVIDEDVGKTTELVSAEVEAKDAYTYMDDKQEATTGYTEKTRLGVRYSELLAFIISAI